MGKLLFYFLLTLLIVHCGSHKSENYGFISNSDVNEVVQDKSDGGKIKTLMDKNDLLAFKKLITSKNIDEPLPETNGATPLIYASLKNLAPFAFFLLNQGANVDIKDNEGQTAAEKAREIWGEGRIIMLLDPQLQEQGRIDFFTAVSRKRVPTIEKLLNDGVDPNFIDEDSGETPLTRSISLVKGNHITRFLATWKDETLGISGTDINLPNREGKTPLTVARENNNQEAIDLLKSLNAEETL